MFLFLHIVYYIQTNVKDQGGQGQFIHKTQPVFDKDVEQSVVTVAVMVLNPKILAPGGIGLELTVTPPDDIIGMIPYSEDIVKSGREDNGILIEDIKPINSIRHKLIKGVMNG